MSDWNVERYREREQHWRNAASQALSGPERDSCLTLADGYAELIRIVERRAIAQPHRPS